MSGHITLVPMNVEQYDRFEQRSLADYADEKIQAGTWTVEEAPERAAESFARYLPQRLDTPHAHLYMLMFSNAGGRVRRKLAISGSILRTARKEKKLFYWIFLSTIHTRGGV